jgi:hypothetical protein
MKANKTDSVAQAMVLLLYHNAVALEVLLEPELPLRQSKRYRLVDLLVYKGFQFPLVLELARHLLYHLRKYRIDVRSVFPVEVSKDLGNVPSELGLLKHELSSFGEDKRELVLLKGSD